MNDDDNNSILNQILNDELNRLDRIESAYNQELMKIKNEIERRVELEQAIIRLQAERKKLISAI
ncbi:MAG: hypothetical protein ACOX4V_00385 [Anaerovoracaceae bacterium]|jgi:vacuolar-type H+-ATPase subunit E/Vma4